MYPISNAVKALFEIEQKQILRITGDEKSPISKSVGPSAMASFSDAIAADALNLSVDITPVQSGSGDPSPTNVRPISGWTGANVTRTGFNAWDEEWEVGNISIGSGKPFADNTRIRSKNFIPVVPSTSYYFLDPTSDSNLRLFYYDDDKNYLSASGWLMGLQMLPANVHYIKFIVASSYGTTYNHDISINYPSTNHDYHAYNGSTYPISWQSEAGTVYGGTLDVTTGVLTVTHGNIASYNGESLPGKWISSMDVYSVGGTPTTGAQVVYELATPQTYQLTPTQIALLEGVNNVWADCGDVTVEYATGYEYEINITDANVMMDGFNIDRFSCNGNKLEIGTACSSELTLKLDNRQGQYSGIVFEGAELFVEVGIGSPVNWIPCGYFTPDEQPRSLSTITIKALDRMTRFDAVPPTLTPWTTQSGQVITTASGEPIYFVSNVRFPITVANLVKRVALLCNVPFTQSLTSFPNYNYTIQALPTLQQDITFRNIIQWCAGIMGTNAWIDWTGSLRFSWYGEMTGYTSTTANRFSSDLHEDNITITGVQYTNTQNVTIVSGSADYAIDMTGNYLAATGIAEILPNVKNAINGFTYRPFTASVINAPYLWPMDMITFNKDGVDYVCAVTNVNFGINGTTALEGKGETAQTNSATAPSGVTNEQAFLVEKATQYAADHAIDSMTQEEIFNKLTNNGEEQALILYNGRLYLNATYINTGTLVADLLKAGILRPQSGNTNNYWNMETGEFSLKSDGSANGINYRNGVLDINANNIKAGVLSDAAGVNTWDMQTGDMNVTGSFTATTEIDGDTYTLKLQDNQLGLYVNNQLRGYIGWDELLGLGIHASAGTTAILDATTTDGGELSGGSYVRVNKSGDIELRGRKIVVGAVDELPQDSASGTITFVKGVNFNSSSVTYGHITVKNGIIVDWD